MKPKATVCTVGYVKTLAVAVSATPATFMFGQYVLFGPNSFTNVGVIRSGLSATTALVFGTLLYRAANRFAKQSEDLVKGKDRLISIASHDLRSPLTAILMSAEAIESTNGGSMASIIKRQAKSLLQLVDSLLASAATKSGSIGVKRTQVNMRALVTEVVSMMRPIAERAGVELHCEVQEHTNAYCDAIRVRQILTNLISNSLKHTPRGGRICVKETDFDSHVCFVVEDNGHGIPQAKLATVFEPFVQANNGTEGYGLGLYIVKTLIDGHNGRIWADSAVGRGTSIFFTLG